MIMLMLIILMVQLQSFQKLFLVISVAPLGLIGVVAALLPTGTPMGFVAILGIIALSGMIIRNSVILIDQIDMDMAKGLHPWDAVIDATTNRFRPIVLTAAAASLGMIPIASEVFWGPMAYAIIGGLVRRDPADPVVPAGPLCRLVPRQGAGEGAARSGLRSPPLLPPSDPRPSTADERPDVEAATEPAERSGNYGRRHDGERTV